MSTPQELLAHWPVSTTISDEAYVENIKSALSRGLPIVQPKKPHNRNLAIAGGGPSLEETHRGMMGLVAAMNGSLSFLLERGIQVWACGVLDPRAHMADIVEARPGVQYFLSSTVHPVVFDKLIKADCKVGLWHPSGMPGMQELLEAERGRNWTMVHGGTTMGMRWLNLGHVMGFRNFHLHGVDSSFTPGKTHAYPDPRDVLPGAFEVHGHWTHPNFAQQAVDFLDLLESWNQPHMEPVSIDVFGTGLIPTLWKEFREANPNAFKGPVLC